LRKLTIKVDELEVPRELAEYGFNANAQEKSIPYKHKILSA